MLRIYTLTTFSNRLLSKKTYIMKTKLLLLAVFASTSFQFINAQCSRMGQFIQSDPAYSISGDAGITFTTSGSKDVIFNMNFATVQGADLRVYLSKTDDITTPGSDAVEVSTSALENDGGGFGGPGVSPITGMMTFSMPSSTTITEYSFIVIQCIAINERWGHVPLGAIEGADCAALSIEENTLLENISFYPNPTSSNIEIANAKQLDIEVSVLDLLGKIVIQTKKATLTKQTINLSSLKSGVYLVKITADANSITKKLVKQ